MAMIIKKPSKLPKSFLETRNLKDLVVIGLGQVIRGDIASYQLDKFDSTGPGHEIFVLQFDRHWHLDAELAALEV